MAGKTTTPQTSKALESLPEVSPFSVERATSRPAVRMVRLGASRSSSTGFQLFPPPVPTLSGRRKKAACLLQTVSKTSLKGPRRFPVPEQFSPVAGGTLQTLATGFSLRLLLYATISEKCRVFSMLQIKINGRCSPGVGSGSSSENPQYRFAIGMNRFNAPRVFADGVRPLRWTLGWSPTLPKRQPQNCTGPAAH